MLVTLAAGGAVAAEPTSPPAPAAEAVLVAGQPLTLDAVMAQALARHAGIAAARAQAQAGEGLAASTAVLAAPVVKLSADRDMAIGSNPAKPVRGKVAVSWAPPQPGEAGLRREQLHRQAAQQQHLAELVRQRVAVEVQRLYTTLSLQDEMLRWSARAQSLQGRLLAGVEAQLQAGRRTRSEWLALRGQQLEGEAGHEALKAEREASRGLLRALLGLPEDAPLWLARSRAPFALEDMSAPGADLATRALARRPELRAAEARCAAVSADNRLKNLDNRRWLKGVEIAHQPQQAGKAGNWELTLELTWSLAGDRHGDARALDALRQACEAERDDLAATIGQELRLAASQRAGAHAVARQHLQQLATLQEAAAIADEARAVGRADELDLLGAQLALARAQVQALRKVLELRLADLALRQAAGQALP